MKATQEALEHLATLPECSIIHNEFEITGYYDGRDDNGMAVLRVVVEEADGSLNIVTIATPEAFISFAPLASD